MLGQQYHLALQLAFKDTVKFPERRKYSTSMAWSATNDLMQVSGFGYDRPMGTARSLRSTAPIEASDHQTQKPRAHDPDSRDTVVQHVCSSLPLTDGISMRLTGSMARDADLRPTHINRFRVSDRNVTISGRDADLWMKITCSR